MRASAIDNRGREADNGDMETTANKGSASSAISLQASSRTEASVPVYYFYHWDHLGTTRLITSSTGAVVSRHDYEPFGVEIPPTNEDATNSHKYTGHERDALSGMDYMHARFYGSSIGRFMRPDPINGNPANPQSWNLYAYVRNNPVNATDPTGLFYISSSSMKNIMAMFGGTSGMGSETATNQTTVGGGGSAPASSNDVSLNVPVYYDAAMNMTSEQRIQDYNNMLVQLAETLSIFGIMGIDLNLYYNGTVEFERYVDKENNPHLKINTEEGKEFTLGSLFLVRSNDPRICGNSGGQFTPFQQGGTGMIGLRGDANTNAYIEEFAHAFGVGRHIWWDTPMPFMGLVTVPLIRWMHYGAEDMRLFASQYTNP